MSAQDWELIVWRRANDLLRQAERIHRNFLQITIGARYRASGGRTPSWEPPVNLVETDEDLWVISSLAGVSADRIDVRVVGRELVITGERPLPRCCNDGALRLWEIPLGRFERRLGPLGGEHLLSVGTITFHEGLLIIQIRKHS